jgi:hypothetical protein
MVIRVFEVHLVRSDLRVLQESVSLVPKDSKVDRVFRETLDHRVTMDSRETWETLVLLALRALQVRCRLFLGQLVTQDPRVSRVTREHRCGREPPEQPEPQVPRV